MLVLTRHRADAAGARDDLLVAGDAALQALAARPGFVRGWCCAAADDDTMVLLGTEWSDVGSWRRAMSPVDVRMVVLPFFATAVDEPSAFLARTIAGEAVHDGAI
jgi:hypothetical protein